MRTRAPNLPTRERLLDAATGLVLEKGFADTTLAEVCDRADLTKGAFFHHFEGKEAMGKAILDAWVANGAAAYGAAPFWKEVDPLERLYGYIDFTAAQTKGGPCGCLVGIFSQELWQSYPGLRADCEDAFTGWAEGLAELLEEAKLRHAPTATFDPRGLAYHFIAVFEGALVLARARERPEIVEEQLAHFKQYVESLFRTKEANDAKATQRHPH